MRSCFFVPAAQIRNARSGLCFLLFRRLCGSVIDQDIVEVGDRFDLTDDLSAMVCIHFLDSLGSSNSAHPDIELSTDAMDINEAVLLLSGDGSAYHFTGSYRGLKLSGA